MHALTGYTDRWSAKQGSAIRFMVSSSDNRPFTLRFVRHICADPNPAGPGMRMDDMAAQRRASQPREASAGCVFKNPEGDKAGRLIDVSGLKGRAVGPVSVSPTHANFLVNAGDAKAADFIELMRAVRAEVKSRQGVELQPEIVALGREWKELL